MEKGTPSFVGGELSFSKLGSVLVGMTGSVLGANTGKLVFEVKYLFWPVDWK